MAFASRCDCCSLRWSARLTSQQFGLDPRVEARRFERYRDQFGIPAEGFSKDPG